MGVLNELAGLLPTVHTQVKDIRNFYDKGKGKVSFTIFSVMIFLTLGRPRTLKRN